MLPVEQQKSSFADFTASMLTKSLSGSAFPDAGQEGGAVPVAPSTRTRAASSMGPAPGRRDIGICAAADWMGAVVVVLANAS